ncbi:MAG: hypothetical protein M1834_007546 [Cirrosporium novae-zelandiae]|nr:MAG: hypothetical protein M1834_007546 [Cirrosporium novae-zelandiae]
MRTEHAIRWDCGARDHDPSVFFSQEEFKTHMQTNHPGIFEDEILDYIAASSVRPLENVFNEDGPFCGEPPMNVTMHIGDHLKYLAFYTLPFLNESRGTIKRPVFSVDELLWDHSDFPEITYSAEALTFDPSVPDEEVPEIYLQLPGNRLGNWWGILATDQKHKRLDMNDTAYDKIISFLYNVGARYSHLQQPSGFPSAGYWFFLIIKVISYLYRFVKQDDGLTKARGAKYIDQVGSGKN